MKRRVVHIASILAFCFVLFSCDSIPGKKTIPDVHFATTPHKVVKEMLKLAEVSRDDTVYDLGSGDGRIVIAAARDFGARGVGVELDKELIGESVKNAKDQGVNQKIAHGVDQPGEKCAKRSVGCQTQRSGGRLRG